MKCGRCHREHDLSEMDPGFGLPDELFLARDAAGQLPPGAHADSQFAVWDQDPACSPRLWCRVLLPVVLGEGLTRQRAWGIWVELAPETGQRLSDMWSAPDPSVVLPCTVANDVCGYPRLVGHAGTIRFVDPRHKPHLTLDPSSDHPFAARMRAPVSRTEFEGWVLDQLHPPLDRFSPEDR